MNKYTCVFSNNLKKQRCGWKTSTELVHISRRISVILIMRFSVALQLTYFCSSCSQACKLFVTCGWNLQFIAMLDCQSLILIKAISNNQQHQHFPWYEEQFFWASDVSETAFLKYILFSHFVGPKPWTLRTPGFGCVGSWNSVVHTRLVCTFSGYFLFAAQIFYTLDPATEDISVEVPDSINLRRGFNFQQSIVLLIIFFFICFSLGFLSYCLLKYVLSFHSWWEGKT